MSTVWEDCLWSDFRIGLHEGNIVSVPDNAERARARAVGYARSVARASEMMHHGTNIWRKLPDHVRARISSGRRKVRVSGGGKRICIETGIADADPRFPIESFSLRLLGSELYFQGLFECELPAINGVKLDLLVSAWELLHSLAEALAARMPTDSEITELRDLWQFAPAIPRTKLCELLAKNLLIPYDRAGAILDFLTFSKDHSEELWARPLVQLDNSTLVPVLTCLSYPNPLRMIEKWMKYGGLKLQERGEAFESHARQQVQATLKSSRMIRGSGVCQHRYKLKSSKDTPGDIDLIVWFGNTILIGEVKCNLFPARASEFHNYFDDLEKAGRQIVRKAAVFKDQTDEFWRNIAKCEPPDDTRIVPIILSNLPLGAGMKFNGVAATDLFILERFLGDGFLERFAIFDPASGFQGGQKLEFYATAEEAETLIEKYLADPPQLHHFRDCLAPVRNMLPSLGPDDSPWLLFDYEVQMDEQKLESFRMPSAETLKSPQSDSSILEQKQPLSS